MAGVVVARFSLDGQPQFELRRPLVIPDATAWRGSRIGTEDKVLPPWTPVELAGGPLTSSPWCAVLFEGAQ